MNNLVKQGLRLRDEHPDWSERMLIMAVLHGQQSPEFADAKRRADAFAERFQATGGWMLP